MLEATQREAKLREEVAAYRLENDELIPTQEYESAARLHTKTVEEMSQDREEANKNAGEADKAKVRPASE